MVVVGIAGGTCSGKSTLSEKLCEKLVDYRVTVLHMDWYFKNPTPETVAPITGVVYPEHNHPDSLRLDDMYADFDAALAGDADVVIIEGLFALYLKELREKLTVKVFVDLQSDERLVRRIKRFMHDRGQTLDEVTERYLDTVRYRHDELIEPTRWHADMVINGSAGPGRGAEILQTYIESMIEKRKA